MIDHPFEQFAYPFEKNSIHSNSLPIRSKKNSIHLNGLPSRAKNLASVRTIATSVRTVKMSVLKIFVSVRELKGQFIKHLMNMIL